MSTSIGSLRYLVSADITDYTAKMAQLRAMRKNATAEEKEQIDKQIRLLKQQQKDEKAILKQRQQAYNTFANAVRSSIKSFSIGLIGTVALASKNLTDMERETKNLSAALSQLGSNQEYLSTLTDLSDTINEITGIDKQLINDAMAIGLQFGVAESDIQDYAKALAALSSKSGKSIQQLAQSLNQMYTKGDFSSLEKLGIHIDNNKSKQEQWNDVINQGISYFDELNDKTAGTLTRNLQTLGNVTGAAFEEAGKIINDSVIIPITRWISEHKDGIINASQTVTNFIVNNWEHIGLAITSIFLSMNKTVIASLAQVTHGIKISTIAMNGLKTAAIGVGVAVKSIGRATVILALIEAGIWAIEKSIDACVWYWKRITGQVILTEEEQDKLNGLLQVSKGLDEQIKAAKEEQVYLTAKLNNKTEEQAKAAVRRNSIETLTKQLNEEQNEELKKQIQHQIDQVKELDEIKTENAKIKSQIDKQKNTALEVNNIEKDTVNVEKQKTTELIKQQDSLSALYKTTSDLNAKWNDMVKPTDNINVTYKQYKDTLNDIKTVQNEIYANQRNLVIDEETRNKNNVILVTKYNDLLSKRNNLTQSLLTAKKQEQSLRQQEEEAEKQRAERQKQEAEALNVKRNQLKLQLEIAKAENSGNKDRAAALKIGQEVNKTAEEYKLSIKDALDVYKTLNKEKETGNGGIQTQPLTKQQQRKQERAKRNLERYEASLATAPGEERKTGVRRISASKEAVERWRREAAGDFSSGDNSKKESVLSRITAKQIEANIPSTSSIEPIIPTTQAATTNSTTTTTQTGAQQAQKAGGTLANVISKIDDLINSFSTFTDQFAQTFSS